MQSAYIPRLLSPITYVPGFHRDMFHELWSSQFVGVLHFATSGLTEPEGKVRVAAGVYFRRVHIHPPNRLRALIKSCNSVNGVFGV